MTDTEEKDRAAIEGFAIFIANKVFPREFEDAVERSHARYVAREAVDWRDQNPSPQVLALVNALEMVRTEIPHRLHYSLVEQIDKALEKFKGAK